MEVAYRQKRKVKMPAVLAFSELLLKRAEGKTIASLIGSIALLRGKSVG
jgi:hypothetical protein